MGPEPDAAPEDPDPEEPTTPATGHQGPGPPVADLYAGPPEEFVTRRDALAKELRAAGRRDDAAAVKRLRKPTRPAWALDAGVVDAPEVAGRATAAVDATVAAQARGEDLRAAFDEMRAALRALAAAAARAAGDRATGWTPATWCPRCWR